VYKPPSIDLIKTMYGFLKRTGQMEDANKLRNLALKDEKIPKQERV
jgi:hypothetical protein